MHVTHYLLLGFFSAPAPAPATVGGAGRVVRRPARQAQGYGFMPEGPSPAQARARRRRQQQFITLHLLAT